MWYYKFAKDDGYDMDYYVEEVRHETKQCHPITQCIHSFTPSLTHSLTPSHTLPSPSLSPSLSRARFQS